MNNLELMVRTIIDYVDENNLMVALSYFEDEVRPIVENLNEYENQEILKILKEQCVLIGDQDWNSALNNIEKLREVLENSQ